MEAVRLVAFAAGDGSAECSAVSADRQAARESASSAVVRVKSAIEPMPSAPDAGLAVRSEVGRPVSPTCTVEKVVLLLVCVPSRRPSQPVRVELPGLAASICDMASKCDRFGCG